MGDGGGVCQRTGRIIEYTMVSNPANDRRHSSQPMAIENEKIIILQAKSQLFHFHVSSIIITDVFSKQ